MLFPIPNFRCHRNRLVLAIQSNTPAATTCDVDGSDYFAIAYHFYLRFAATVPGDCDTSGLAGESNSLAWNDCLIRVLSSACDSAIHGRYDSLARKYSPNWNNAALSNRDTRDSESFSTLPISFSRRSSM